MDHMSKQTKQEFTLNISRMIDIRETAQNKNKNKKFTTFGQPDQVVGNMKSVRA
jgi:hypothetical protein